jgi:hypothetical protein
MALRNGDGPGKDLPLAREWYRVQSNLNLFARDWTNPLMLEVVLTKRGRRWEWRVLDLSGKTLLGGRENSRPEAKYQGERALFQMLANPTRSSEAAD